MSRMIFVNVAVSDLDKAKAFFGSLGFSFDPVFTDERAACLIINEGASYAMLLQRDFFKTFVRKEIADSATTTEVAIALSAASREEVDQLVDKALELGGTVANEPLDEGFMYGRSFYDLDGHQWEVMWMDDSATQSGAA